MVKEVSGRLVCKFDYVPVDEDAVAVLGVSPEVAFVPLSPAIALVAVSSEGDDDDVVSGCPILKVDHPR